MQRNIQRLVEAELLLLKRLIVGFIIFSISIPNVLYAQSTTPITTSPTTEKSQFPVVTPANFEILDSTELARNANLILDELEFLLADKNPRIVLNSYDKKIINDYYTLSKNEELVKQIGANDTKIIDEFVSLYDSTETQSGLTIEQKAETLLKYIDSVYVQLTHPLVQSNFGLARNDLEVTKNDKLESSYRDGVKLITRLQDIIQGNSDLPEASQLEPLDRRIIEYLLFLVTPTDRGGAGHERVRVQRIWKNYNYEDEKKNISKETENATNVSAHKAGQACDVDQIDMVRCAIWQYRRLGGIKVKKQTPKPIAVNYQTDQGVASAPPPTGDNFNELFKNTAYSALLDALADEGIIEAEYSDSLQGSSFSDLLKLAGEEILRTALLDPKNALSGESITDTIEKVGRVFLADELNIPREAVLYGSDVDEIEEISGRYLVEQMIGLEKGSLRHGNTSRELITSTGLRHIEAIFDLSAGSLDGGLGSNETAFIATIGQQKIASELGISSDKLSGNKKSDWEKAIGKEKFNLIFSQPAFVDEMLGLEYGSTLNFKTDGDAQAYKKLVGEITIEDKLAGYGQFDKKNIDQNDKSKNARAEAFGLPNSKFLIDNGWSNTEDLFEKILKGDNSAVYPIGAYRVAVNSVNNLDNTGTVFKYLTGSKISTLDETLKSEINNNTNLKKDQFSDIFKNDASIAVFRYYGNRAIINGIKNNPNIEKAEEQLLQDFKEKNPELYGSITFRVDRINEAQRVAKENSSIARKMERTITDPEIKRLTNEIETATKSMLPDVNNPSIDKIISGASNLLKLISQLLVEIDKPQNNDIEDKLEQYIENLYTLEKLAHEIISGETYENTRDIDIKNRNSDGSLLTDKDVIKFLEILSEKDTSKRNEEFTSFILSIGSRQLDNALDLPENSFYYMFSGSSTIVNISDSDTKICDENKQKEIDAIHKKYDLLEKELIDKALYSAPSAPLGTDPEAWQKEQFRQLDEQEKKEIQQTQSQSCKSSKSTINTSLSSDGFLIAIGQAKFEEYFDKKASSVNPKLIIRSSRKDIEDIDRGLSIEKGLTAKYLEDSIKLEEYFKAIGERTVELQLIDGLADDLSILGVALTATDIYNILNGDGEYTLARIGGLKIDETLDLPGGTGEAIISAKNNDERALAVAQVSGGWLFEQLGFNPLLLSGDISQRFAQDEIEKFFNFPQNSFKPTKTLAEIIPVENVNWFNRKTIFPTDFADEFKIDYKNKETGVLTYLSDTEYTRALVNKDKEYFDFLETDVQSRVLNYSPYYWRSDLNNLESPIYKRSAEIDNHFGLPKDTTKNFLLQVISPAQYIDLVQENYIGKQLENDIIKAGIKGLTDTICSNDDKKCKAIINTAYHDLFRVWYKNEKLSIEDWNAEDRLQFYHGLTAIFDVNLNEKAHLPTGTIEAVLADPANAEQTLIYGGLRSIEMEVGLERDKGKKPGYLTDAYNYYISHKSERKKTIPTEEEQKVCRENNGAKRHALEKEYEEKIQKTIYDIESSSLVDFQKQAEITRITGELEAEKQQKLADLDKNCLKEQRDHKDTLNNKSKTDKAKDRAMEELKEHLNDFFKNQLHVDLEGEGYSNHLEAIVRGDMQFLTYVGVASIAGELNSFEKDGQKIDLPPEYRITYEDVWKTQNFSNQQVKELSSLKTSLKTTEQIEMEYEIKLNQIIQDANKPPSPIPGFDEAESKRKFDELEAWKTDQLANIQDPEKKQEDIREENRRRFQGKVFTAFAYQIDQHIPADFGYVMFYGTDEQRLNTAFNYGVNYALDATNLNQYGITSKGVEALKNYLVDKSGTNWEIVKTSGIFGGIETLINQKDLFGFQLQEGSIAGLAEWAKTGDYTNLLNTYEDWATGRIFAFGDKLFGFEEGTTATIYQTYQAFDKAKDAYEAAKVAKTATDIAKAKAAYAEAATILITLIITMAFSDQIASMEESLGLVPGTGAILVGMVVGLFLGVPVDPITVVIFILINLIGVYKVKIYCTVDGYYPEPNYVSGGEVDVGYEENLASPTGWGSRTSPSQSLNVGGGVFDGMKSKKYQEGLKLGAQLKIKDTIGDTLDFPFYFDNNSVHISKRQKTPDDYSLPTQVLTFDQKHADTYWNTSIYKQVFKNNNPSENNKRGIGFSPLVPDHIHTGF